MIGVKRLRFAGELVEQSFLLPLREKVSAKLTDEGFREVAVADEAARPLTRPLRGHPLPQGERDVTLLRITRLTRAPWS